MAANPSRREFMEHEHPGAASPLSFAVAYEDPSGASNADFSGSGRLTLQAEEPVYRFTGKGRGLVSRDHTLQFRSNELWNVAYGGRAVQFDSTLSKSGAKGRPFVFYCETPEAATEVARLLPRTRDEDFVTRLNFRQQLGRLPGASSPWTSVTNLLIAANVVAFVIMGLFGAGWITTASMSPYLLFAANNAGATTDGEWWRVFTCMFVHYGLLHLALNMWALYQTGHFVEKLLGRSLFLTAYLGSGLIASFTSLLWHGDKIWSAGASGAVFGVFGMLIGFMLREKQSIPGAILKPMMRSSLTFAGYNLVYGMILPRIDNAAHIGGLAGGLVLGWLIALPLEAEPRAKSWPNRMILGVTAIAVAVTAGVIFSPRYNYSFREELAWQNMVESSETKENQLLLQQQNRLASHQRSANAVELTAWLEADAIPFYEGWIKELESMQLTPGRLTEKRRSTTLRAVRARLANYRELVSGLQAGDPQSLARFTAAEKNLQPPAADGQP